MSKARGADYSNWQDAAHTLRTLAGMDFAIAKATEGVGYIDPTFAAKMNAFARRGIVRGAYAFLTPHASGAAQWDFFEKVIAGHQCLVAADYEAAGVTDQHARDFIRRGHSRGYKVGLYGSSGVARKDLGQDWTWAAWWSSSPPPFRWQIWQFAAGKTGDPDWNVFNGDKKALLTWAQAMTLRSKKTKPRWWIHDKTSHRSLGPYMLPRAGAALIAYALRHPGSRQFEVVRA